MKCRTDLGDVWGLLSSSRIVGLRYLRDMPSGTGSEAEQWRLCMEMCTCCSTRVGDRGSL